VLTRLEALDMRLKRAGIPIEGVFDDGRELHVTMAKGYTKADFDKARQILASHTEEVIKAEQDDFAEDQPVTRRELKKLIEKLRAELKG